MNTLEKEIKESLASGNQRVVNALGIAETHMEVPPTPSSLYDFTATLQSLKHTKQVLLQYLQVPTMVMIQK